MRNLIFAAGLAIYSSAASANEFESQIRQYISQEVMNWASEQVLIDAILAQNSTTSGLSNDEVLDLDLAWRAELDAVNRPTISPVISNPAAIFLQSRVQESEGAISEVFLMDVRGLNVAASSVTSDYWQGDEGKFQNTFLEGAGAIFIDEIEYDDSTQTYLAQVSLTVSDPSSGLPIGAMTIGLNAESLF